MSTSIDLTRQRAKDCPDSSGIENDPRLLAWNLIPVEISSLLLAARFAGSIAGEGSRPRRGDARLRRVLEYINTHLNEALSVGKLAGVACLSTYHFCRIFRSALGLSPQRYVTERRVEQAMELIAIGDVPLSRIALSSGFSSQASFTRAFKRVTGMAPGTFRRASR